MASLFLSHSSADNTEVARFRDRLEAKGYDAYFLDFDPDQGIPAGVNWERRLYAELRRNDAVLFFSSPSSIASRWCFAELVLARSVNLPVIEIGLFGGSGHPLLESVQRIDLEDADADERLWRALSRIGIDPLESFRWDPNRPSYPGLEAFTER